MQTDDQRPPVSSAELDEAARLEERRRLVDEIASDEAMPIADRQARLEALAEEWGLQGDVDAVVDPFAAQVAQALSLLAKGGHS